MNVDDLLRKLEPLIPGEVARWRTSLPLVDAETRHLLEQHIVATAQRLLGDWTRKILLPPPTKKLSRGPIWLGSVVYDKPLYPFGLNKSELLQGLGIYGRSGAGKTNVVFGLLRQLERHRIPFLFLDWKRTARHALPLLRKRVNLFTVGRSLSPFAFNLLIPPPGLESQVHISQLADILGAGYTLGDGAKSLFGRVLHRGLQEGSSWPDLKSVCREIEGMEATGRAVGWKTTLLRALQSLAVIDFPSEGDSPQAEMVRRFLVESTIVELDGLNDNAKKVIVPILVLWLYHCRLQARDREQLKLVVVIEEAHHLLYRQESRSQESVMNRLLRQCRELGIAAVVVDQHPHLVSSAALGNTYSSLCLNLKEPTDINRAAAVSLLGEQEKRILTQLPVGCAVAKLQDRFRQPFLLQFPNVGVDKGAITDEVLSGLLRHGRTRPSRVRESGKTSRQTGYLDPLIGADGMRLLVDCLEAPTDGVRARYLRLGFSMQKGQRLKDRLVACGLLSCSAIPVGRTRRLVLQPTRYARNALGLGGTCSLESVAHRFWARYYADRFRAEGYLVETEAPRIGGRVDVLAKKGNERVAIEIETGKSDYVGNTLNCLESGFDRVILVASDERAKAKVELGLAQSGVLSDSRLVIVVRDRGVTAADTVGAKAPSRRGEHD